MATVASSRRSLKWSWKSVLPWAALGLALVLLAVNLAHDRLFHRRMLGAEPAAPAAESAPAAGAEPAASATTVSLPEGKFQAAQIATEAARMAELPAEVSVVGRIEPNLDLRVDIRPRASGVVRAAHVLHGQKVKKGELLATLSSPDVGKARLDLRARQRELATVRAEARWKDQVAGNVAQLIPELRQNVPAATIQKEYADRPLGNDRALLIQAYTELEIARHEKEKQTELFTEKIIGEHPYYLAVHTHEGALAKFEAALEQVKFDVNQQKRVADDQVRLAEGVVIDAAQRLRILGVEEDIGGLLSPSAEIVQGTPDEDVTVYRITAPFDGSIIMRNAVPSQKADLNDVLFTLADLRTVWVRADIHESNFAALPALRDGTIRLTATAYPGRTFQAKLLSIGSVVDPMTRTVPLRAETENPDDMLKLGMFVRIVLDSSATQRGLTVPSSAVVEIEGHKAVFVPSGRDGRTFTFHPVELGREAGDRQVVLAGLSPGDRVVSAGAFLLKSELILQNETEDE